MSGGNKRDDGEDEPTKMPTSESVNNVVKKYNEARREKEKEEQQKAMAVATLLEFFPNLTAQHANDALENSYDDIEEAASLLAVADEQERSISSPSLHLLHRSVVPSEYDREEASTSTANVGIRESSLLQRPTVEYVRDKYQDDGTLYIDFDSDAPQMLNELTIVAKYKSSQKAPKRKMSVVIKGDAAFGEGVDRSYWQTLSDLLNQGFCFNWVDKSTNGSNTQLFTGTPQRRLLLCNTLLKSIGFYQICGRMIAHMFLYSDLTIYSVSPLLLDMLLEQPVVASLDDLFIYDPEMVAVCNKVLSETADESVMQTFNAACYEAGFQPSTGNNNIIIQGLLDKLVVDKMLPYTVDLLKGIRDVIPSAAERRICIMHCVKATPQVICADDFRNLRCGDEMEHLAVFLKEFINNATEHTLRQLSRFWTGLDQPPKEQLSVCLLVEGKYPQASTCLLQLQLAKCDSQSGFDVLLMEAIAHCDHFGRL